ncbi:Tungstate uptake system ATP-binding protein TupC [bioreactor metagenome]|uniref:Tungstate uptake system ATP-binding protein TupC n=1 Tax=bioreactor metagenome TaxID=1076179 RepID=A0A645CXU3_9ZZZZ
MFELKNVKFRDILTVDELELKAQQVTCIVGKSGGGKTTLLKLLNNLISADSGTILYKGKEIDTYNPIALRREVMMLPQQTVMFSGTIRENFNKTLRFTEQEVASDEVYKDLLQQVGLKLPLEADTKDLSGGEKQRVALARVLLLHPETLLLDEPSSALDDETEDFIIGMVVDYTRKRKGTLIMVTHAMSVAERFADVTITLFDGKIQRVDKLNGTL